MASFTATVFDAPTRTCICCKVRLLIGQELTPSVVVELALPLLFNNVVATFREGLKQNLPSLRAKLNAVNSPQHSGSLLRLYVLVEGTVLEVIPQTIDRQVLNDAQLILTVDGHDTTAVLQALQINRGVTRHGRTESGTIAPQSGLGKRAYRSYTMRLRIASDMGKYGSITPAQKALLKDLVIAGDRQLENLLEQYETDADPEPLLSFLKSPAAQAARVRSRSQMTNSLSGDLRSLSVEKMEKRAPASSNDFGEENDSFDFDAVMAMGGSFDMLGDSLGDFNGELYVPNDGDVSMHVGATAEDLNGRNSGFEDDLTAVLPGNHSTTHGTLGIHSRHSSTASRMGGSSSSININGNSSISNTRRLVHARHQQQANGLPPTHRRGHRVESSNSSADFGNHSFGMNQGSGQLSQFGSGNMQQHAGNMIHQDRNMSYGGSGIGGKEVRLRRFRRAFSVDLPGEGPLFQMLSDPEVGVTVKVRKRRKFLTTATFPPCFVGSEAVTWMCENIPILYDNRSQAVELGKMLLRKRDIAHVKNSKDFEDSHSEYYTFRATTSSMVVTQAGTPKNEVRMGNSGVIERDDDMIGPLTRIQRKAKVQKWIEKRARMKKNRLEGKGHKYQGRTKFANARRRVKGRFVTLEFMNERGIKFDSEKPGWVCSTLNNRVFLTADEAVKAVDAQRAAVAAGAMAAGGATTASGVAGTSLNIGNNRGSSKDGGNRKTPPNI